MLFIEKIVFKNGGKKCLNFIFIRLGEVLTSCLHTLLRDQTPCSSLSKRFCEFRLILILENGFEEKRERPQRLEKEKRVRLVQLLKKIA